MYSLNLIRFSADMLHLAAHLLVLFKILRSHSVAGLSMKTQELYAIVFICRYLDVFWNTLSVYLTVMKIIFMSTTVYTIYLMRYRFRKSYNASEDTFPHPRLTLILPCAILSIFWHKDWSPFEVLWSFSIFLEAVAILPQLFLLHKSSDGIETITTHYIACLGGYRVLYIVNWVYRVITEPGYRYWLVWISGFVQTVLYIDFFYYYARSIINKRKMALPTA